MNRILGRVVSLLGASFIASALMPACVDNDRSIFVRAVLAPSTNRQNGGCVYTDDPQQPQLFQGLLDVGVRDNYFAVVLVGNQMIPRGDPTLTRAESNRVHINGAIVRVTEPDGTTISEFTSYATGFADPQQNNNPDYAVAGITLIDAATSARLAGGLNGRGASKLVLAQVKAFGKSLGGVDVESAEFQFPLRLCNGCTVSFEGADDPAREPHPNCLAPLSSGAGGGGAEAPCFPGQDEVTPCQLCQGRPACDPANP